MICFLEQKIELLTCSFIGILLDVLAGSAGCSVDVAAGMGVAKGEGVGGWKDIEGGTEGVTGEVAGEGKAGARWVEELCGMVTGMGCIGLADNMVDDGQAGSLTTAECVFVTSGRVMGRRGKRREQETQGDVNGIID